MQLFQALRLSPETQLAFAGAGGKTTALFQTARQAISRQLVSTAILTATTHLATEQIELADHHFRVRGPGEVAALEANLPPGVILVSGEENGEGRVSGLDPVSLERIRALSESRRIPLLIEADGSRRLPLKAPADHEPDIPPFVDEVVLVAGLSGLGKPLAPEWVHRPARFAALTGLSSGETITMETLARLLLHADGGLKNMPPQARRIALLNQADTQELQAQAQALASQLLVAYHAVIVASLAQPAVFAVHEKIAGILLAAGESSRFGQPKQLLPWRGEPLVRHAARVALDAGLSPLVVVSGAYTPQIRLALDGLPVQLVHNPEWEQGQSTSLQAGLRALPPFTGGAIFLLADQPQVTVRLVRTLVETHARELSPLVAPLVDDRRGNPVLFDQVTFPDLMRLSGDIGGRPLFQRYPATWVPWHDPNLLLDVDTPEDYQRLLKIKG